jgi:hypothetical protein
LAKLDISNNDNHLLMDDPEILSAVAAAVDAARLVSAQAA